MPKYNFEMDLAEWTSTGIIAKKLKHGMTVLEFGCSYGRMTRYMKETLGCDVYIVEYDSEAYESAIKYAKEGICGDIQRYEWVTKFQDIKFDVIIFADVLEHLSESVKVLKLAGNMLAEDGKVIISIPNATHNDIILKSYMERIDYTSTGILDDTHVHFWGLENLETFAKDSELYIESVEATYVKPGLTEQFSGEELKASWLLLNMLNERKCGDVYQFIMTLQKTPVEISEERYHLETPYIYSHIYLDRGQGFNATDNIPVKALLDLNGVYHATCRIEDIKNLHSIRFDPIELQECIIRNLNIRQGTEILSKQYIDSVDFGQGILLRGKDPQVIVPVVPGGEPVYVDCDIVLPGEECISILEQALADFQSMYDEKEKLCNALKQKNDAFQVKNEKDTCDLKKQPEENVSRLGLYQMLADRKDTYIVSLDKVIAEKDKVIAEKDKAIAENDKIIAEKNNCIFDKDKIISEKTARITELDQAIEHYRRYPGIRLIRFVGRVLRGIKRGIKVLVQ